MGYVPLEKLIPKSGGSMYKLAALVARRALELADGAPRLVEAASDAKVTTIAMREIAEGKVGLKDASAKT